MKYLDTIRRKHKNALFILIPLILINAGVLHIFVEQVAIRASANQQVLDENVSAQDANAIDSPDPLLATDDKPLITEYAVISGDTIGGIAQKFDISANTIRWANNMGASSTIRVGQKLKILPVSGIQYKVASGDTISGIATKFNGKQSEILDFNNLDNADKIKPGLELIIPDGVPIAPPKPVKAVAKSSAKLAEPDTPITNTSPTTNSSSRFVNPMPGSILSQGLHDGTAVDFAAKSGTDVIAAASGTVIAAKDSNVWNGGYGYYIILQHDDGVQTLYGHLSRIDVEVGDSVEQGEHIALSGRTGRVTGPHLHFEVRGAFNPFAHDRRGTQY